MNQIPIQLGGVVRSKAGRDAGMTMIIIGIDQNFVLLADGQVRRVEKPKRKKNIHVHVTPYVVADIATRLTSGQTVENHQLRKALDAFKAE